MCSVPNWAVPLGGNGAAVYRHGSFSNSKLACAHIPESQTVA